MAAFTAVAKSAALGTVFATIGVVGACALYLNVCGFQTKRIRPGAPVSPAAPTLS